MVARVNKREIDSRVAREMGATISQVEDFSAKLFEVLRDECSLLEEGETVSYIWLTFESYMTKSYIPKKLTEINPLVTTLPLPNPRLKLKAKIKAGFYADEKKGLEGNLFV